MLFQMVYSLHDICLVVIHVLQVTHNMLWMVELFIASLQTSIDASLDNRPISSTQWMQEVSESTA